MARDLLRRPSVTLAEGAAGEPLRHPGAWHLGAGDGRQQPRDDGSATWSLPAAEAGRNRSRHAAACAGRYARRAAGHELNPGAAASVSEAVARATAVAAAVAVALAITRQRAGAAGTFAAALTPAQPQ